MISKNPHVVFFGIYIEVPSPPILVPPVNPVTQQKTLQGKIKVDITIASDAPSTLQQGVLLQMFTHYEANGPSSTNEAAAAIVAATRDGLQASIRALVTDAYTDMTDQGQEVVISTVTAAAKGSLDIDFEASYSVKVVPAFGH